LQGRAPERGLVSFCVALTHSPHCGERWTISLGSGVGKIIHL
jgi:hypothetical protein